MNSFYEDDDDYYYYYQSTISTGSKVWEIEKERAGERLFLKIIYIFFCV